MALSEAKSLQKSTLAPPSPKFTQLKPLITEKAGTENKKFKDNMDWGCFPPSLPHFFFPKAIEHLFISALASPVSNPVSPAAAGSNKSLSNAVKKTKGTRA